ncbi:MAG: hypothetical protein H6510_10835 [Acidobacteria bacterium]|nr:hypothetical protein [Acidobacteriota bacterium]MCB9398305.1 hypothetical protein [Acidobacteriota bacterium]
MKKAFSIVEVMISLLILLIGLMGLALAFQKSIYQTNSSKNDSQAMMIAAAIVDALEAMPFDDIPNAITSSAIANEHLYDYQGNKVGVGSPAYYTPAVSILNSTDNFILVQVTVNWTGWSTEVQEGGFGLTAPSNAFTLVTAISQQYGDDLLAGTIGAGSGGTP